MGFIDAENGGILLIDKPLHWTSFDIVKKVRNLIKIKKIGHAGTLDPLATGLLILAYGKKTKLINTIQEQTKTYSGTIILGKTTPSYDLETVFDTEKDCSHISEHDVENAVKKFSGKINQVPPSHSAIKIEGKRAYTLARQNQSVELKPREVIVYSFEIIKMALPEIYFSIQCSKGTYIRSLAHDLGQELKVGGYLASLRREKIGEYDVSDANSIEQIQKYVTDGDY